MSNPSTMAYTSLGLGGFGTLLGAMGTFTNASAEKDALNANARLAEYGAQDAAYRGDQEALKVGRRTAQIRGTQRASMAARGLDISEGSPLEILAETDYFAALDRNAVKDNTKREIYGFRAQAANDRARAKAINPWLMAGASGLAGAGMVADRWYQYKKDGVI